MSSSTSGSSGGGSLVRPLLVPDLERRRLREALEDHASPRVEENDNRETEVFGALLDLRMVRLYMVMQYMMHAICMYIYI